MTEKKLLLSITKEQLEQLKEQGYLSPKGLELLAEVDTWDKEDEADIDTEDHELNEEFDYTHR